MKAIDKNRALLARLQRIAPHATLEDASTLRRAELTLHRWAELECGDSNDYASWAIERDETTGIPYYVRWSHDGGPPNRERAPDRERGALRRVAVTCERLGLDWYHQTDPRGCALYVARIGAGMRDVNYSSVGVSCAC